MSTNTVKHWQEGRHRLPRTLVTGATSGIGWAVAQQLAHAGVPVVALGRDALRLQALAGSHPLIDVVAHDLSDVASLPDLAARLVARFPDLGCLINNAGVQYDVRVGDAGYGVAAMRHEIDVNLLAPMVLSQALLPQLQQRGQAWIVNVTSGLAFVPKRTAAVYSASKAGLHLFTRALRVQLEGAPVAVVEAVMPLVETPMTRGRGRGKLSAAEAAQALIAGLHAGQLDIYVGKSRALPWLRRWAPGLLSRLMQRG